MINNKYIRLPLMAILCITACSNPVKDNSTAAQGKAFSLKNYFAGEAKRLHQMDPEVIKTVTKDNEQQTKTLKITNWEKELSQFSDADINKPAWNGNFKAERTQPNTGGTDSLLVYTNTNDNIPVRKLSIVKKGDKVSSISVIIYNQNALYTSTDTLEYSPDKGYSLIKKQNVRALGEHTYKVIGQIQNQKGAQ